MTKDIQEVKGLVEVAESVGLEEKKAQPMVDNFQQFFQDAVEKKVKAMELTVTSETQIEKMQQARDLRLDIKKVRIDCEKKRKELKEDSLKTGRLIDGMSNVIKGMIEPTEEHLLKQEKYAEIKEDERKEKKRLEREKQLSPYVEEVALYNLKDMTDEAFNILLRGAVSEDERIKAEDAESERQRIAEEERKRLEQEQIVKENEELKKQSAEKDDLIRKERAEQERKQKEADELRRKEIEKAEDEKAKIVAKLKAEQERNKRSVVCPKCGEKFSIDK